MATGPRAEEPDAGLSVGPKILNEGGRKQVKSTKGKVPKVLKMYRAEKNKSWAKGSLLGQGLRRVTW